MILISTLICLIPLTSQLVHSKVITINTSGNASHECCSEEGCLCASLSTALQYIDSNTVINITSLYVTLEENVELGSGKLTNITITGSNVTIMCNNSGSVYCESCDDVMIEGITWDRCGDPNGKNIAGVTFNGTNDISLINCTFQRSLVQAVYLGMVSGSINVNHCNFLLNQGTQYPPRSDCGGLNISSGYDFVNLIISDSYFYNNVFYCGYPIGGVLSVADDTGLAVWNVTMTKTNFISNVGGVAFGITGTSSFQLEQLKFYDNEAYNSVAGMAFWLYGNSSLFLSNSLFTNNTGCALLWSIEEGLEIEILLRNSNFTNARCIEIDDNNAVPTVGLICTGYNTSLLFTLVDIEFSHSCISAPSRRIYEYSEGSASLYIAFIDAPTDSNCNVQINLTRVNLVSNTFSGDVGGAVYIKYSTSVVSNYLVIEECEFFNNTSHRGAALYIQSYSDFSQGNTIFILNSTVYHNIADDGVIYIDFKSPDYIVVRSSNFTENIGSTVHLLQCELSCENVIFADNIADNGAALYIDQGSSVTFDDGVTVRFINNSAAEHGGAIYIHLGYDCYSSRFSYSHSEILFVNNTAEVSGNSLYFYLPTHCMVETNISDSDCILYMPCKFNYSQPVNSKMMHIPCDLDYTLLNNTGAPIVTSPHELRLYFPFNNGYNISSTSDNNVYFIRNNILGRPVKFAGAVFDYFGKPAEPTQFKVEFKDCASSIALPKINFLIDNITSLSVTFSGANIEKRSNVTVELISALRSIKQINVNLIVELLPCIDHPGYTYSTASKGCVCYHHNVECYDNYTEIKRGYWFGSVMSTATTTFCPRYCNIIDRKETREGYYELPNKIHAQCNDHRVGIACGECSSGYTLSYDSTDCISVDQCGTGWTVLVISLTCLYWIAVVAGVFSLMYFKFQISLGYLYGLIYYYSVAHILMNTNPYISDDLFYFISVLSSFAQITPQFLGKLCFIKGLSGIDQLFIQYSHAVGVSLLLLLIVVAARCSTRISLFVSRCIIRVICLLILLSYTSITSTSMQLLQPLRFTDVKEWYTYSSPHIQYFHGRHAVYAVVAVVCELVIVIGLPLLLFLEPFLNRRINFIRIKPLLDQFQGCYKDKYRCFAAYYLICRQVILLIIYSLNYNYYDTLFYLQVACVVIALIHIWIQPYQSDVLNALDGVMLLLMIQGSSYVVVNDTIFLIVAVMLISLPLIFFSTIVIRKVNYSCSKKKHRCRINNADVYDRVAAEENIILRYVHSYVASYL